MTKTITTVCFAVLVTIPASACRADDRLPSEALRSVKKICPEVLRHPMVVAIGNLSGKGFQDVAAIVNCKSTEYGERQDEELIVLYGQQGGSYKIAYRSEVWPWNGRSEKELEIKNKILAFSEHCAYNCNPESWASSYKFKMRNNDLILAGEDHSSTFMSGKKFELEETSGNSVNYLTQKVIYWKKTRRQGYSEKRHAFKLKAPLSLSNFNLETCIINGFCMPTSVSMPRP
ncbi:hypothetical protein [Janthinobacterium sp. 17J80-10]|uniref:hypothetical protein n=1 Tax=Janthinobacterium sp. 17J80-10 TaxID=2497863 RepID=UPI0010055E6E|nr:hypothetical protein [Janthinobacterium sp. 17J80-10]QAU33420.1 hypothetical protein EKL02_04035 [Janthinobacterium sp. 17J80-10]